MSTILKALRRLEEEKTSTSQGRPLREEVASRGPGPPRPGPVRRWAPAGAALLLGLLAGGVAFWTVSALLAPETRQTAGEPATRAAREAPAPDPARGPSGPAPRSVVAAAAPDGPPEDAYASDVEVVPRQSTAPRIADDEPIEPRRAEGPGSRRPVETSAAAARARQIAEMQRTLEEAQTERLADRRAAEAARLTPEERILAAAPSAEARGGSPAPSEAPAGGAAGADARSAPSVDPEPDPPSPSPSRPERAAATPGEADTTLARATSPDAPDADASPGEPDAAASSSSSSSSGSAEPEAPEVALRVERTEWHPLPDRRRAWVAVDAAEPRTVVEGDVVGGVVVSKIEPSGVVFERDGEPLRRGVGGGD